MTKYQPKKSAGLQIKTAIEAFTTANSILGVRLSKTRVVIETSQSTTKNNEITFQNGIIRIPIDLYAEWKYEELPIEFQFTLLQEYLRDNTERMSYNFKNYMTHKVRMVCRKFHSRHDRIGSNLKPIPDFPLLKYQLKLTFKEFRTAYIKRLMVENKEPLSFEV